jgi:hypothetical protein
MTKKFVFKSNQIIGTASAETDGNFLSNCFINTGDFDVIYNTEDPRNILIGRTGAGKSALITRIVEMGEHAIQISPESLALSYIANSNVLRFFVETGVKLDIFYRLLWRHVLCVEVLKERFNIDSEDRKKSFIDKLWSLVPKNKADEQALNYLREWGESFWLETEYRIKEVTTKLEQDLKGSIEGALPNVGSISAGTAKTLTEEQKEDVVHRAQEVVNKVQIKELSQVIRLIDNVLLSDRKQRYYVTIDRLDEDWVEDELRLHLIRALIETSVEFSRIQNLKVVIAIRSDLLDRVFRYTRDAGFQEEKIQTSCLKISWNRRQIIEVLDARIKYLFKSQYTSDIVKHHNILPAKVGKQATIDYIIDRTLMRPRDIIQFFNSCIMMADGKANIPLRVIREAEGQYSRDRLKALFDEWYSLYPNLQSYFNLLKGKGEVFAVEEITTEEIEDNLLQIVTSGLGKPGLDYALMLSVCNGNLDISDYKREIVFIFYKVALVSIKIDATSPFSWSHLSGVTVSTAEITESTRLQIHKMYSRVLGVSDGQGDL